MQQSKEPPEKKKKEPAPKKDAIIQHLPAPLINTMEDLHLFSAAVFKSKMWAGIQNPETAMVRIQAGRELGLQPIMALNKIHCTPRGDIIIATAVLGAVAMETGVRWQIIQKDVKGCKLRIYKLDGSIPEHTESFMLEDAIRAKLHTKDNYKMYPEEMFFNRCLSKGLRVFDPRIGAGFYTKEEMEDVEKFGTQPAEDTQEEEVIEGEIVEEGEYQEKMEDAMKDPPEKPLEEQAAAELNESPEVAEQKKKDIGIIKERVVDVLKLPAKDFKLWLYKKQQSKIFVRTNKFGHLSLHLGDADAIAYLMNNSQRYIRKYVDEWMKGKEPGEKIGCFTVPEPTDA